MSDAQNATYSEDFRNALTEHIDQVVFAFRVDAQQFSYLNPSFEQVSCPAIGLHQKGKTNGQTTIIQPT